MPIWLEYVVRLIAAAVTGYVYARHGAVEGTAVGGALVGALKAQQRMLPAKPPRMFPAEVTATSEEPTPAKTKP